MEPRKAFILALFIISAYSSNDFRPRCLSLVSLGKHRAARSVLIFTSLSTRRNFSAHIAMTFDQRSTVSIGYPLFLHPCTFLLCPCTNHQPRPLHGLSCCLHRRWIVGPYSMLISVARDEVMDIQTNVRLNLFESQKFHARCRRLFL